jgi:predicted ATPase
MTMSRHVVITGCSGGGKSTLLAELARRGHAVVEEPGRRVVEAETLAGGTALPWTDMAAFLRRVFVLAAEDRVRMQDVPGWVFFDRGLVDAATALQEIDDAPWQADLLAQPAYHRQVFMVPPWPEIYLQDTARRHGMDEALREHARLCQVYPALGYSVSDLPRASVPARADFILSALAA